MVDTGNRAIHIVNSKGLITRKEVSAEISRNQNQGIRFILSNHDSKIVEAKAENIFSTQRNTVIAKDGVCVCLTEHFLAACALLNIDNIDVKLSEDELPFGDGSSQFWVDFFQNETDLCNAIISENDQINDNHVVDNKTENSNDDRFISIAPAENFKVTYKLDWDHPLIGKQEFSWELGDEIGELAKARTFSSEAENKMLGLDGWVVGYSDDGFSKPLLFDNEPARHKALDLIGDLMLSGINPLKLKAHITSNKGGHQLNAKLSKKIASLIACCLICFFSLCTQVNAEIFSIQLSGSDLKNVAATEITLKSEPEASFKLQNKFRVAGAKTLFTTADQENSKLRIFFSRGEQKNIQIIGKIDRVNYSGEPNIKIEDISYISKIGKDLSLDNITHQLVIKKDDNVLPFMGIVKAEILGPPERIFQQKLLIAVANVESYGFEFNKSLRSVKINGVKAKFLNENTIAATLSFDETNLDNFEEEFEIELEIEVQDKIIKKKIGSIKLLESVSG